jgi:hypothetical protein
VSTEQPGDQGIVQRPRGRKAVHWRRDALILERLAAVERLHLARWTNVAIARELSISENTVRLDIKRLGELWIERLGDDVVTRRSRRIAQLEDLAARAVAAAEFDERMERAVLLGEDMEGKDGEQRFVQRDAKMSAQFRGNKAAALQAARQAVMDAAKLEGLVVDKVAPTDGDGNPLTLAALIMAARTQHADEDGGSGDGGIIDGHLAG